MPTTNYIVEWPPLYMWGVALPSLFNFYMFIIGRGDEWVGRWVEEPPLPKAPTTPHLPHTYISLLYFTTVSNHTFSELPPSISTYLAYSFFYQSTSCKEP